MTPLERKLVMARKRCEGSCWGSWKNPIRT